MLTQEKAEQQQGLRCPSSPQLGALGTPTRQILPARRHPSGPTCLALGWFASRGLCQGQALHPSPGILPQRSICSCSLQPAQGCDGNRASAPRRLSLSTLCAGGTCQASSPQHCRSHAWDRSPHISVAAWRDQPVHPGGWGVPLPPWAQPPGGRGQSGTSGPTLRGTPSPSSAHTSPFVSRVKGSAVGSAAAPGVCCSAGCFPVIPTSYFSHALINPSLRMSLPTSVYLSVHPPLCISLTLSPGCISIPRAGADRPLLGTSLGIFLVGRHAQLPRPATPG